VQASYYLTGYGAWSIQELRRLRSEPDLTLRNESFMTAFEARQGRALEREQNALLMTYLPDNNLARMDRASMANGVETRAPFLNPALLEFSGRLPLDLKVRGTVQKYILRKALAGSVPAHIVQRPKHGFNALPMRQWLRHQLSSVTARYLDPKFLKEQGVYEPHYLAQILAEHRQGGRFNHWWKLWLFLVLQMWLGARSGVPSRKAVAAIEAVPKLDSSLSIGGSGLCQAGTP
jgi:asparagine synthase (glutamine-hydrolysing)